MTKLICWIKTLWRSKHNLWRWETFPISGHDYVEQIDGSLVCEVCGDKTTL